ncbi:hypothetical protein [Salinicoccus roseus]|uniref:Uncharacterized protein n=1 Tax=Salinicoccus roseus TaxID=45670 RepID=A0A265E6A6_9STAP|nr:hypothetical protein [Salinicoccus roseus]OZT77103.1 hypothetical protein CFN03_08485 [Salinicoccus roseus]
MVNIYDSIRNENGDVISDRTRLFVREKEIGENGEILGFTSGRSAIADGTGHQYVVDEYIIEQVGKLQIVNGELVVKDGEVIEEPEKTPEEIEREQLLARLAELDGA